MGLCFDDECRVPELQQRIAELEDALYKYGTHLPWCEKLKADSCGRLDNYFAVCTCGLDAARKGKA